MKNKLWCSCFFVVTIIFLSSISSVVSSSDYNECHVDYSVKCFGMDYEKTFSLSQEDKTAIESLIEEFRITLSQATTRAQVKEIFNEVILDLDEYGLFCDLDTEQVQKLVTNEFFLHILDTSIEHISIVKNVENDSNFFCLIAGNTEVTYFEPHIGRLAKKPTCLLLELEYYARMNDLNMLERMTELLLIPMLGALFLAMIPSQYNPLPVCCDIGLGTRSEGSSESRIYPANGWITTIGLKGIKHWGGQFYGHLHKLPIITPLFDGGIFYPGVSVFTGLRLSDLGSMECFYLGTALCVKIGPELPYEYYPFHWE